LVNRQDVASFEPVVPRLTESGAGHLDGTSELLLGGGPPWEVAAFALRHGRSPQSGGLAAAALFGGDRAEVLCDRYVGVGIAPGQPPRNDPAHLRFGIVQAAEASQVAGDVFSGDQNHLFLSELQRQVEGFTVDLVSARGVALLASSMSQQLQV
jgi:hypothetical protein